MKTIWNKKFPTKVGEYWFYGYRYKRVEGYASEKEFMIVKVRKCSNGLLFIANGQFMHESEIEEGIFCKAIMPELPKNKNETT